eukprot:5408741-Prymnesium_polylepis.1
MVLIVVLQHERSDRKWQAVSQLPSATATPPLPSPQLRQRPRRSPHCRHRPLLRHAYAREHQLRPMPRFTALRRAIALYELHGTDRSCCMSSDRRADLCVSVWGMCPTRGFPRAYTPRYIGRGTRSRPGRCGCCGIRSHGRSITPSGTSPEVGAGAN